MDLQHSAAKDHTIATHKTVSTDHDRVAVLAVVLQIDGMVEQLGVVASEAG